jgi:hypothetical protein
MTSRAPNLPHASEQAVDHIAIDFLYLDLTTCTRCVGTDESLEAALGMVRDVLTARGAVVDVRKTLVETAAHARELRLVSSPTIRVNGRDIAHELKESPCGSEPCGCGCEDDALCRVWSYRGQDYTEAPLGLIVDAILTEVYGGTAHAETTAADYDLPANLEAFFAAANPCCSSERQATCCAPEQKADCCGPASVGGCAC